MDLAVQRESDTKTLRTLALSDLEEEMCQLQGKIHALKAEPDTQVLDLSCCEYTSTVVCI